MQTMMMMTMTGASGAPAGDERNDAGRLWMIATEEALSNFNTEDEALFAFNFDGMTATKPRILYDPSGQEVHVQGDNPQVGTFRTRRGGEGKGGGALKEEISRSSGSNSP